MDESKAISPIPIFLQHIHISAATGHMSGEGKGQKGGGSLVVQDIHDDHQIPSSPISLREERPDLLPAAGGGGAER
jgi:hypothetical protein